MQANLYRLSLFFLISIQICCHVEGRQSQFIRQRTTERSLTEVPSSLSHSKNSDLSEGRRTSEADKGVGSIIGGSSPTKLPSFYWAVLHNWLYFVSLGFNLISVPFLVREIIDGDPTGTPSAKAIALSGNVEAVDKFLTFAGIGLLSALSDKFGRKPLMAWSAFGFMVTNLIQATTKSSVPLLYFADFVDGCSSCMLPLCQAFIADVSPSDKMAVNLGIFQGLSAGCAFILAFPIGGILGAKFGPRVPLLAAAGLQLLNGLIILLFTPESNQNRVQKLNLREDNPIGGLVRLFGTSSILAYTSAAYFLSMLAKASLDAQFVNYSNIRFGWSQAQSGPVLVIVGLMLAVAPRFFVPWVGLRNSILIGLLVFSTGLAGTGLAPRPPGFISGIFISSIGCMCFPAFQALFTSLAKPKERGALLGAVGSVNELTAAIGSSFHAGILAKFTSEDPPLPIPGMHFLVGSAMLLVSWGVAVNGFIFRNKNHAAFTTKASSSKKL